MLFIRSLFFYIFFISSIVLVSLLINILYLFVSTRTLQNICKYWITLNNKVLSFFCNINYEVSGYKHIPNEPCIVIANHQGPWRAHRRRLQARTTTSTWVRSSGSSQGRSCATSTAKATSSNRWRRTSLFKIGRARSSSGASYAVICRCCGTMFLACALASRQWRRCFVNSAVVAQPPTGTAEDRVRLFLA